LSPQYRFHGLCLMISHQLLNITEIVIWLLLIIYFITLIVFLKSTVNSKLNKNKKQLAFSLSSLILANYFLPLIRALFLTGFGEHENQNCINIIYTIEAI
jgi:hypothetical protein